LITWRRVETMKLLIAQISPAAETFILCHCILSVVQ
jgi:hypothetical protein